MSELKNYNELSKLKTFEERYSYLKLGQNIGEDTFGFDRYLNQHFYSSPEWKHVRDFVIIRDNGCDLGISGNDISGKILVHHMNPISKDDILGREENLLDPNFLICVSQKTHNAIHYGNDNKLINNTFAIRTKNDTIPWR